MPTPLPAERAIIELHGRDVVSDTADLPWAWAGRPDRSCIGRAAGAVARGKTGFPQAAQARTFLARLGQCEATTRVADMSL